MINKKRLCLITAVFLLVLSAHASVMAKPRKTHVISTKYFDFLFSDESKNTALFLAQHADAMFDEARNYLHIEETFRVPVVISPDSQKLQVTYSPLPYNRIVVYEGVPERDQAIFENTLLATFYQQIILAVNESLRSPFAQFVHKIVNVDAFQPVVLLNLPFSFLDAIAYINNKDDVAGTGRLNDRYFLQILTQAKLENKFPTWFQACAVRDIYPGTELVKAAGAAFSAYILQRWGYEKYVELWKQCSKLNLKLFAGNFYTVYGVRINEVWDDFEKSIPLPDSLSEMLRLETHGTSVFWNDSEAKYDCFVSSEYGIIWYDDIRHEVDIYDFHSPLKTRQLLFLADSITRMQLSADGRYLVLSFNQFWKRDNFVLKVTRIYDLKERSYVSGSFYIRDGALINLEDGSLALAGINVTEKYPVLQVYALDEDFDGTLIFERAFDYNSIPFSPVYAGNGKLNFLLNQENKWSMCQINLVDGTEKKWKLTAPDEDLMFCELRYCNTRQAKNNSNHFPDEVYMFQYVPKSGNAFTRMGYITVDEDYCPAQVFTQAADYNGGVYSPIFINNLIYFSAHKLNQDDFVAFPITLMPFTQIEVREAEEETNYYSPQMLVDYREQMEQPYLGDYLVKKYNPVKYWLDGTTYPLVGIVKLDISEGTKLWPGLGFTYTTKADPFESTSIMLSGIYGFAKLDFSSQQEISPDEILEKQESGVPEHKDASFSFYLKNTSTQVDILGGAVFDFNPQGQYDFNIQAGTAWNIPFRMNSRRIRLVLKSDTLYSTEYSDKLQMESYPDKKAWVSLLDAYTTYKMTASALYKNVTQYGTSVFETRGLELGGHFYALWDVEKMKESFLETYGTDAPDLSFDQYFVNMSQLNLGVSAKVAIPRITPLQTTNGWVLSVPSTVGIDIMGSNGRALETYAEMLLIGHELQNGLPFLYLYFNRFGLKGGYDLCLNYDTNTVSLPDLRTAAGLYDVFANVHPYDAFYLKFIMDFVSPIGKLSSVIFKSEAKASYYLRTKKFKFSVNVDIKM